MTESPYGIGRKAGETPPEEKPPWERPVTASLEVRESKLEGLRIHWLNALIIGATILVWLTLIGGLIAAVGVGVVANSFGGGGGINDIPALGTVNSNGSYTDPLGDTCQQSEVDENGWCP